MALPGVCTCAGHDVRFWDAPHDADLMPDDSISSIRIRCPFAVPLSQRTPRVCLRVRAQGGVVRDGPGCPKSCACATSPPPPGMHWKGGGYPPPGRPAYAQPLSPSRQVPVSTALVPDGNRPQPLWQPPPTACPTARGTASEVPSLLMHPCPLCDIPSGCYSFTRPWTVTRSSLRMLRRVAAFCRPVGWCSCCPVVGVLGLCWMWRDVPFARQRRPIVGVLGVVLVVDGVV